MKKIAAALLCLLLLCYLCACNSFNGVTLKESIELGSDGIVAAEVFEQIRDENAVVTFKGASNGYTYEWTVFGSDIKEARDADLALDISAEENGTIIVGFHSKEEIGIPLVLSIRLSQKWQADSAVVYMGDEPLCTATVTGSKSSILNFSVTSTVGELTIRAESNSQAEQNTENTYQQPSSSTQISGKSDYLSGGQNSTDGRVYSDGKATKQDEYKTDPVPEGKPLPAEPEDQVIDEKKTYTCTFSIECTTILNNLSKLESEKLEALPKNGIIFKKQTVEFYEGESVFDLLKRVCKENKIHLEAAWTPLYNSAYIEGIGNLYELDCGELSGWMYSVNGWYPNYGSSRYQLSEGDTVEWRYSCELGQDIGNTTAGAAS